MSPRPPRGGTLPETERRGGAARGGDEPLVSVVILNWRRWAETIDCVESVFRSDYPRFRAIVCDNDSQDDSMERMRGWAAGRFDDPEGPPPPTFLQTGANLGFSGGCNAGIALALEGGADYVFLLNNDARVAPETLSRLVDVARESGAAVVGCRVRDEGGTGDAFAGARWPHVLYSVKPPRRGPDDPAYWPTDYATGCAVLLRRDLLEGRIDESGYALDPAFFMYWEDVDLGLYAKANAAGCVVARDAVVVHGLARSSGGAYNPRSYYYLTRNRIAVADRWLGPAGRIAFHLTYAPSRLLIQALGRGGWRKDVLKAIAAGLVDGYRGVTGKWSRH